jgi:hypothetical protein
MKSFRDNHELRRHQRVHTGVRNDAHRKRCSIRVSASSYVQTDRKSDMGVLVETGGTAWLGQGRMDGD